MLHLFRSIFKFSVIVFTAACPRKEGSMRRVARGFLVACGAILFSTAAHSQSDEADGQDPCRATGAIQFDLIEPFWSGDLAKSQSVCFVLEFDTRLVC